VSIQGVAKFASGASLANNRIANLAAGASDTDAINVGQLRDVATTIGANVGANGSITAPTYNVQGNTYNSLVQALTSLDTSVTNNTTYIDNIVQQMKDAGLVDESGNGLAVVTYNADKSVIHLAGANGTQIKNVADGVDDMDAVNVRQLRQMGMVDEDGNLMSAVTYNADKSQVMLAGVNGTVIGNVADGQIAVGSEEAVNGGQLAAIRDELAAQVGDLSDRVENAESQLGVGQAKSAAAAPAESKEPIDMGGGPVQNVGAGVEDGDMINVGQLTEQVKEAIATANQYADKQFDHLQKSLENFKGEVNERFRRQDAQIHKIGAMSAANAHMAINAAGVAPGRGRIAVGMGVQRGEQAVALGFAKALSETTRVSVGGAVSGQERSMGASIGVDL
jgi:autotransporter adhesin